MMMRFAVTCPGCGKLVHEIDFGTDKLALKEFQISHLCKRCQDSVFPDEDMLIL